MKKCGFEKGSKDKEQKRVREGSKKDMAADKKQVRGMKCGGKAHAKGGQVRGTGCATKGMKFSGCE